MREYTSGAHSRICGGTGGGFEKHPTLSRDDHLAEEECVCVEISNRVSNNSGKRVCRVEYHAGDTQIVDGWIGTAGLALGSHPRA